VISHFAKICIVVALIYFCKALCTADQGLQCCDPVARGVCGIRRVSLARCMYCTHLVSWSLAVYRSWTLQC